jgi:uncharacterized oxidoreductase
MKLQGKRALITGGSSGIGFAIAEAMSAEGAHIVITGRRPDILGKASEKLRASGGQVDFVAADVSTEKGRESYSRSMFLQPHAVTTRIRVAFCQKAHRT